MQRIKLRKNILILPSMIIFIFGSFTKNIQCIKKAINMMVDSNYIEINKDV